MHELGICDAILKTVDGIARDEKLSAVHRVTLEVGMLSGVVPRFLSDCWQAVIDGTPYQDTELVIETIDGLKVFFDDGWVMCRPSGTEGKFRIYSESTDGDVAAARADEFEKESLNFLSNI